ncbi:MAG TPA: acyl-CoA desaturase [Bacteroidales bacterium]|nr:acyl-CoA desaturase [Bacteroidales bacterium]
MVSEKLSFPAEKNNEFMLELRKRVDDYFAQNNISKYGNTNLVVKTIVMLLLYLGPYFLMVTGVVSSTPLILVCWILMGLGMAGVGMNVMHDANHGGYSKNHRLNNFLSYSLYILGGLPITWRIQHNNIHHSYTNIHGHDADIEPVEILRFSPHKPHRKIHRFQHLYAWILYGLMTLLWITTKDFQQLVKYRKMGLLNREGKSYWLLMLKLVLSKIAYYIIFIAIPLYVLPIPWYTTLLFFFIMHFIAGVILATIFQTAHVMPDAEFPLPDKEGKMENNWIVHQLSVTTDYAPNNKILTWLVGGLNYHAVHHLFPHFSHVHYKNISSIVKEVTDKYGITYHIQPTFFKAIGKHVKMLKLLGKSNSAFDKAKG